MLKIYQTPYLHHGERSMDGRASNLYGNDRVEDTDSGLEGLEIVVLVGENTKTTVVYTETDTGVNVLLGGFEPGISLGLLK